MAATRSSEEYKLAAHRAILEFQGSLHHHGYGGSHMGVGQGMLLKAEDMTGGSLPAGSAHLQSAEDIFSSLLAPSSSSGPHSSTLSSMLASGEFHNNDSSQGFLVPASLRGDTCGPHPSHSATPSGGAAGSTLADGFDLTYNLNPQFQPQGGMGAFDDLHLHRRVHCELSEGHAGSVVRCQVGISTGCHVAPAPQQLEQQQLQQQQQQDCSDLMGELLAAAAAGHSSQALPHDASAAAAAACQQQVEHLATPMPMPLQMPELQGLPDDGFAGPHGHAGAPGEREEGQACALDSGSSLLFQEAEDAFLMMPALEHEFCTSSLEPPHGLHGHHGNDGGNGGDANDDDDELGLSGLVSMGMGLDPPEGDLASVLGLDDCGSLGGSLGGGYCLGISGSRLGGDGGGGNGDDDIIDDMRHGAMEGHHLQQQHPLHSLEHHHHPHHHQQQQEQGQWQKQQEQDQQLQQLQRLQREQQEEEEDITAGIVPLDDLLASSSSWEDALSSDLTGGGLESFDDISAPTGEVMLSVGALGSPRAAQQAEAQAQGQGQQLFDLAAGGSRGAHAQAQAHGLGQVQAQAQAQAQMQVQMQAQVQVQAQKVASSTGPQQQQQQQQQQEQLYGGGGCCGQSEMGHSLETGESNAARAGVAKARGRPKAELSLGHRAKFGVAAHKAGSSGIASSSPNGTGGGAASVGQGESATSAQHGDDATSRFEGKQTSEAEHHHAHADIAAGNTPSSISGPRSLQHLGADRCLPLVGSRQEVTRCIEPMAWAGQVQWASSPAALQMLAGPQSNGTWLVPATELMAPYHLQGGSSMLGGAGGAVMGSGAGMALYTSGPLGMTPVTIGPFTGGAPMASTQAQIMVPMHHPHAHAHAHAMSGPAGGFGFSRGNLNLVHVGGGVHAPGAPGGGGGGGLQYYPHASGLARAGSDRCIRHGGGRRCKIEACKSSAEGLTGLCIAHGGGKRCVVLGCPKSAQGGTNRCKAHGGGRRCSILGCTTAAEGKGDPPLCKAHGGGKRCQQGGGGVCSKSVHGGTPFCVAHGGGKRCKAPACDKSARGKTDFCVRHGGGKRCTEPHCGKSAQGSTDLCKGHGGGKRCTWIVEGNLKAPCGKFARTKTGLCPAHSALVSDTKVRGGDISKLLQEGVLASAFPGSSGVGGGAISSIGNGNGNHALHRLPDGFLAMANHFSAAGAGVEGPGAAGAGATAGAFLKPQQGMTSGLFAGAGRHAQQPSGAMGASPGGWNLQAATLATSAGTVPGVPPQSWVTTTSTAVPHLSQGGVLHIPKEEHQTQGQGQGQGQGAREGHALGQGQSQSQSQSQGQTQSQRAVAMSLKRGLQFARDSAGRAAGLGGSGEESLYPTSSSVTSVLGRDLAGMNIAPQETRSGSVATSANNTTLSSSPSMLGGGGPSGGHPQAQGQRQQGQGQGQALLTGGPSLGSNFSMLPRSWAPASSSLSGSPMSLGSMGGGGSPSASSMRSPASLPAGSDAAAFQQSLPAPGSGSFGSASAGRVENAPGQSAGTGTGAAPSSSLCGASSGSQPAERAAGNGQLALQQGLGMFSSASSSSLAAEAQLGPCSFQVAGSQPPGMIPWVMAAGPSRDGASGELALSRSLPPPTAQWQPMQQRQQQQSVGAGSPQRGLTSACMPFASPMPATAAAPPGGPGGGTPPGALPGGEGAALTRTTSAKAGGRGGRGKRPALGGESSSVSAGVVLPPAGSCPEGLPPLPGQFSEHLQKSRSMGSISLLPPGLLVPSCMQPAVEKRPGEGAAAGGGEEGNPYATYMQRGGWGGSGTGQTEGRVHGGRLLHALCHEDKRLKS
eukprot:jgi/Mesen1/4100/ME000215S03379